jgi:hypothetical protein
MMIVASLATRFWIEKIGIEAAESLAERLGTHCPRPQMAQMATDESPPNLSF